MSADSEGRHKKPAEEFFFLTFARRLPICGAKGHDENDENTVRRSDSRFFLF
jgi:hypothetical protein